MNKRTRKKLIKLMIMLLLWTGAYFLSRNDAQQPTTLGIVTPPGSYRVLQVHDGDTISVDMNGQEERVRLIGIDTPETQDPRKVIQCFGKAATKFTTGLIATNPVRLEADPENTNRDRYNRLLRYVYLPDGKLVNAELIREGYAFAYTSFPFTKLEEFRALQKEAREQNRGLWSSCEPEQNEHGGFSSSDE